MKSRYKGEKVGVGYSLTKIFFPVDSSCSVSLTKSLGSSNTMMELSMTSSHPYSSSLSATQFCFL